MRLGFLIVFMIACRWAEAAEPVLVAQPPLGAELAAFPRLAAEAPPAQRINKALTNADIRLVAADRTCRADATDAKADLKDVGWQRSVTVAMRGAGYLALVAADTWYCGGPYPDAASFALAYDLRTGAPLNWARLLPKTLVGTTSLDTAGDGTELGVMASAGLQALYVQLVNPDADCASVLRESKLQFMLWPDAAREGVAMQPSGLAHAIAACGPDVVIPVAQLRTLGVNSGLIEAVAAGHRAGLYGHAP